MGMEEEGGLMLMPLSMEAVTLLGPWVTSASHFDTSLFFLLCLFVFKLLYSVFVSPAVHTATHFANNNNDKVMTSHRNVSMKSIFFHISLRSYCSGTSDGKISLKFVKLSHT